MKPNLQCTRYGDDLFITLYYAMRVRGSCIRHLQNNNNNKTNPLDVHIVTTIIIAILLYTSLSAITYIYRTEF